MVINMELIFLDRDDLKVLDFGYVEKEFTIVIDSVIPQKSNFNVNSVNVNAEVGDLVVVKDPEVNYIGIITSIQVDEDKMISKVQTTDFISILDIKIKLSSFSGNVSLNLYNLITNTYKTNSDSKQNISYLSVSRDYASVTGSLTFEPDTIDSISSVVKTLNKAFSIGVKYNLVYDNGTISGIELHIVSCTKGFILKSNYKGITKLVINSSGEQSVNKVVFYPSSENVTYKSIVNYYLLTDGTVSTNASSDKRYKSIKSIAKIYKDADYSALQTTAQSEMLTSSLEHSITFNLETKNKVVKPFIDINVGDFIEFITPTKTYETMVTQLSFKNNLYEVYVTLGEYRISLTDKIKLLSNK